MGINGKKKKKNLNFFCRQFYSSMDETTEIILGILLG